MEIYLTVIFCIIGIVLFLYGIMRLSKKFEALVKEKITFYLRKITKSQIKGTLFGFIVTALNQSSSATTVLTLILASSGLLSFYNSLGILFGANIGTTITVNLVAFGITKISFGITFIGFVLSLIKKTKKIGELVFYVGLVFFGLFLISLALDSLKSNPVFINILSQTKSPFLALLYSILFTAIIQSSAITVSSAIILGQQGMLELPVIIAIIIGANIGTTLTVLIVSIGGSLNSKRTAFAHFFFNIGGALLFLPFLWHLCLLINSINIPIANKAALFHVFFNIVTATIFLIIVKPYSKFIIKIVPGKDESIDLLPHYLNKIFIKSPDTALTLVKKELKREFALTEKMLKKAIPLMYKFNEKTFEEIGYIENAVDNLQGEIASFLDELSRKNVLTKAQLNKLVNYSFLTDSIERIADRTVNMSQISRYKYINKEKISETIFKLLEEIGKDTIVLNSGCIAMFENKKYPKRKEEEIKEKIEKIKELYKERIEKGKENPSSAMLFSEFLTNIERIVDNCNIIAKHLSEDNKLTKVTI